MQLCISLCISACGENEQIGKNAFRMRTDHIIPGSRNRVAMDSDLDLDADRDLYPDAGWDLYPDADRDLYPDADRGLDHT